MSWARSAVPFRIPTTCGQQKTLPWIRPNSIDNPTTTGAVVVRMFLEIVTFRSLFRNTRMTAKADGRITYQLEIFLWLGALAFHYAFAAVLVRHLRFFMEPVPLPVKLIETVDSFFQFGLPVVYLSGVVLAAAVIYLALRRVLIPTVRYISLANDYFPLFLIFRHRLYRDSDALLCQGGHCRYQGVDHGAGDLQFSRNGGAQGDRWPFLRSLVLRQRAAGLFSLQ